MQATVTLGGSADCHPTPVTKMRSQNAASCTQEGVLRWSLSVQLLPPAHAACKQHHSWR